jgi:hypothetical protein
MTRTSPHAHMAKPETPCYIDNTALKTFTNRANHSSLLRSIILIIIIIIIIIIMTACEEVAGELHHIPRRM